VDSSRIYYFGISFGGGHGVISLAVEPRVRFVSSMYGGLAGVGQIDASRLRPARDVVGRGARLAGTVADQCSGHHSDRWCRGILPLFNENMPLRDGVPLSVELADGTTHEDHDVNVWEGQHDDRYFRVSLLNRLGSGNRFGRRRQRGRQRSQHRGDSALQRGSVGKQHIQRPRHQETRTREAGIQVSWSRLPA